MNLSNHNENHSLRYHSNRIEKVSCIAGMLDWVHKRFLLMMKNSLDWHGVSSRFEIPAELVMTLKSETIWEILCSTFFLVSRSRKCLETESWKLLGGNIPPSYLTFDVAACILVPSWNCYLQFQTCTESNHWIPTPQKCPLKARARTEAPQGTALGNEKGATKLARR